MVLIIILNVIEKNCVSIDGIDKMTLYKYFICVYIHHTNQPNDCHESFSFYGLKSLYWNEKYRKI